jgi:antitoxin component YwqK of YwqJK toxin-antitoxin module
MADNNDSILNELYDMHSEYVNNDAYVYKMCNDLSNYLSNDPSNDPSNDSFNKLSNDWLVIMEKTDKTITNENRKSVINKEHAKFRASRLKVIKIINVDDPTITKTKIINMYEDKQTIYEINKDVVPDYYNNNEEVICTGGIHYFRTLISAYYYRDVPNKFVGKWSTWHDNGQKKEESFYIDEYQSGFSILWYDNGQKQSEGKYICGVESGKWIYWYDDGKKCQCGYFLDGYKTGTWVEYYSNDMIFLDNSIDMSIEWQKINIKMSKGDYNYGLKTGHWTEWYINGRIKSEGYYSNGEKTGIWTYWYSSGDKESGGSYKNGNKSGYWIEYTENNEYSEGDYIDGNKTGPWTEWYNNKQKKTEGEYLKGNKTGQWIKWNKYGQKHSETIFENNIIITHKKNNKLKKTDISNS